MKLDQTPITTTVQSLSHEGRGIAHIDGKATFIRGALPNEKVKVALTKKHSRYNEANLLEVLEASPNRNTPLCQHTDICGGCAMQHIDATQQILQKQTILLEQLKHFGGITPDEILAPLTGPTYAYRHKARLGVRYVIKKEKLLVGFREHNNRYLADLSRCEVLVPQIGHHLNDFAKLITHLKNPTIIAQIEIACGENEYALIFRNLEGLSPAEEALFSAFGKANGYSIYLQAGKPYDLKKLWPLDDKHRLKYSLSEYHLQYAFHPLDFTQINPQINAKMVTQALQLLQPEADDHILDLFCGLGNFSLPLALKAKHVTGVEGSVQMVERAAENAKLNGISNIEFHVANLAENGSPNSWNQQSYAKILIDPPRSGAQAIIPMLVNFGAKRIVYVSCNPATLARDAGLLVQQGYRLTKAGVMDMFPHTSHVESIALFEKDV